MANSYPNATVLSKVQINGVTYYLKDLDARTILDSYKNAVNYNVNTAFDATREELATEKAIAAYINQEVAGLAGAMHFKGSFDSLDAIDFTPAAGDIVIIGTKEYVYGGDPAEWKELGDEGTHASKAYVDETFVPKTLTVAGIALDDAITVAELQTALELKALAYKDSASGSIVTADSITGAAYKPEGSVGVVLSQTSTAISSSGSYQPKGEISNAKVTAAGRVSIAADENGTQITGSVAAPEITVTPATASVQHLASLGTLPSYTAAQYTAPSVNEAKSAFATQGVVAAIDSTDAEMLVFSNASTSDALTATNFNAGDYVDAEFDAGALPTFGTAQTVVTGITSATASAPVFTGGKFSASFTGSEVEATGAAFTGTEETVTVSGNYDKAGVQSTSFTGTDATITPTLVTSAKTVTVQ